MPTKVTDPAILAALNGGGQPAPTQQSPSAYPGVIQGRPKPPAEPTPVNPRTIYEDERDFNDREGDDAFNQKSQLREKFAAYEPVKNYSTVIRYYGIAARADDTTAGDQTLINSFAKMQNPDSTVMQGEFDSAAQNDTSVQQVMTKLKREFGWDGAGRLSPQARNWMLNEMQSIAAGSNASYRQAREYYSDLATRNGFDPFEVIGPHAGEPFLDDIRQSREQVRGGVNDPTNASTYANGVQFGMDGDGDAPFDRSRYLQETYGITPEKEDRIAGMWNANLRNPNLSVDSVKQWYAQEGVPPPDDKAIAATIEEAKRGVPFSGLDTVQAEKQYTQGLDAVLEQRGADPESASGAIGINAAQGIMLEGGDEVAGVGGFLGAAIRGQNPVAGYQAERDLIRREQQRAQEARPTTSTIAGLGGALVTGGVGFGTVSRAGALAGQARAAGNTARAADLGRTAVRASVAPGAATGGIYGFNSGEGAQNSLAMGALSAGGGAVAAPVMQAGVNKIAGKVDNALARFATQGPTAEQRAVVEAGARREVPVRQPDVRPEVRGEYGAARTSEKGGPLIRNAEANDTEAMERAVARDVAGGRQSVGREGVGTRASTAITRKRDSLYKEAKVWYDRADKAAGGQAVAPTETLSRLDNTIATLKQNGSNSNAKTITYLEGLRQDFANGLTVAGIRDQRTNMRANIREAGLDLNKTEALVLDIIDGASADLQRGLSGSPQALNAYKKADALWSERATFTREVRDSLLGRKGDNPPNVVADRIKQLAKDNPGKFKQMWDVLEPDDQADIAATFAISQGRDSSGNWSPARFVSDLTGDDLGTKANISPAVMRIMFGEDGMKAIADLKLLAGAKKAAGSEINNSKTGNIVQKVGRGLRGLLLTGLGFAGGGFTGAVAAPAAGQVLTSLGEKRAARLLLNSDFTGWLKSAPNTGDPRAIDRYFARLDSIAARSPVMIADVAAFKSGLRAANENIGVKAAAGDTEEDQRQQ